MLDAFVQCLQTSVRPATEAFHTFINILDTPGEQNYIDRLANYVQNLPGNTMSEHVQTLVDRAIRSVHYIAMRLILPTPLCIACVGSLALYKFTHLTHDNNPHIENLIHGLAFGSLISAAKNLIFLDFVACLIDLIAAGILFSASPLLNDISGQAPHEE